MALLRNSLIVSGWTLASRGLGFARDLVIANKLGAGMASDAFFVALQLPNLLRRLFGEGAFNVAFVPLLAKEKGKSTEEGLRFASAAFSWLLVIVTTVTLLGVVIMPWIVTALVPGWTSDPAKFALTVELGRITFPYLGLITVAAFLGALCNTWGKFAAYAMVPALLNLSILLCLFALPETGMSPAEAAAWSVPLGGIAQALYMLWAARRLGLTLRLAWLPKHPDLRTLLLRLGPAVVGVGVLQLSLVVDNFVASMLGDGVVSYLQYANRFYQLPLSLIGIAVATVLLPQLAVMLGEGKNQEAGTTFATAFATCLTLAIGAAMGLSCLAFPLLATFFAHGEFTVAAAFATSLAMIGFVVGLPGYIITKVTAPAFFANGDPMTPVKASGISLLVNIVGNGLFVLVFWWLGHIEWAFVGIAFSTAMGGYTNAFLQVRWLRQKGFLIVDWAKVGQYKRGWAVLIAAMLGYGLLVRWGWQFDGEAALLWQLGWLAVVGGGFALVFAGVCDKMGLLNFRQLVQAMKDGRRDRAAAQGLNVGGGAD